MVWQILITSSYKTLMDYDTIGLHVMNKDV